MKTVHVRPHAQRREQQSLRSAVSDTYYDERRPLPYGTFIRLKPDADVVLSGSYDKHPPKKWIANGLWAVDEDLYDPETGEGPININRVLDPYPGAYCSFIEFEDIEEVLPARAFNQPSCGVEPPRRREVRVSKHRRRA